MRQITGKPILLLSGLVLAAAIATPAAAQVRDETVGDGMKAPLRDLRIDDRDIPEVLQLAASAPYSNDGTRTCNTMRAQIAQIDSVLGPDADQPPAETKDDGAIAAGATRGLLGAIVPGWGLVRVITGADKADRRVLAAVQGGLMRRAYLKGLGVARGCRPPGSPMPAARAAKPHLTVRDKDKDDRDGRGDRDRRDDKDRRD